MKTQIWIAVSIHVLVAIARKRLGLEKSLYQILQIFSITSLEKVPILQVFEAFDSQSELLDKDRKSTRLNSSHGYISYAVFCLKKKKENATDTHNSDLAI